MPKPLQEARHAATYAAEHFKVPTDTQLVDRFLSHGIVDYTAVACSVSKTMHPQWEKLAEKGNINFIMTANEHSLPGIAAGIHLATGRTPLIHMQNSGLTNAADGFTSFMHQEVFHLPGVVLVTWRGAHQPDQESEPHKRIGEITEKLTKAIFERRIYGNRFGHNILHETDRAVQAAKQGHLGILRLAETAFKNTLPLEVPQELTVFDPDIMRKEKEKMDRITETKGTPSSPIAFNERVPRDEALRAIKAAHPDAVFIAANGYNARATQAVFNEDNDTRILHNPGYMGGALTIGWAMAKVNPDIQVIIIDGDENAQMNTAKDNLMEDYPENLNWYILNNGVGASVGVAKSIPLALPYYQLGRVIQTLPDDPTVPFPHSRVNMYTEKNGKIIIAPHFRTEEAQEMVRTRGVLPTMAEIFKRSVQELTARNRALRGE